MMQFNNIKVSSCDHKLFAHRAKIASKIANVWTRHYIRFHTKNKIDSVESNELFPMTVTLVIREDFSSSCSGCRRFRAFCPSNDVIDVIIKARENIFTENEALRKNLITLSPRIGEK